MTERSDIHKYSIVNRQSSIPVYPGWDYKSLIPDYSSLLIGLFTRRYDSGVRNALFIGFLYSNASKKILKHLDLWNVKPKPPPRSNGPPTQAFIIYDESSSSPSADDPPSVLFLRRDKLPDRF